MDGVNGSNRSPGTESSPFRSLEQARDVIRIVRSGGLPEGGITVWIRGGTYERTSTFTLSTSVHLFKNESIVLHGRLSEHRDDPRVTYSKEAWIPPDGKPIYYFFILFNRVDL